jgi:hypothetical protein
MVLFNAENLVSLVDDGEALGVGEGPFVIGAFAGLGVGGGEGLAEVSDEWETGKIYLNVENQTQPSV